MLIDLIKRGFCGEVLPRASLELCGNLEEGIQLSRVVATVAFEARVEGPSRHCFMRDRSFSTRYRIRSACLLKMLSNPFSSN